MFKNSSSDQKSNTYIVQVQVSLQAEDIFEARRMAQEMLSIVPYTFFQIVDSEGFGLTKGVPPR